MPKTEIANLKIVIFFLHQLILYASFFFICSGEFQTVELNLGPYWHLYTRAVPRVRQQLNPCDFNWVYTYILHTELLVITFQIKLA